MKKIASFAVDHDKIGRGMFVSRTDGDVVTYDLRFKKPNGGDYLSCPASHTIEHLLATYLRSGERENEVVYIGPMGCRTGFYILLRDSVSYADAIALVKDALGFISQFDGEIPGATRKECGNFREHDLAAAKKEAEAMCEVLREWKVEDLIYPQ